MLKIIKKITNKAYESKVFENFGGKILSAISTLAIINASAYSGYISAQSQATIEEVVVTSRKKEEGLQSVPLSVSALGEEALEQKGVNVFEDYLLQLPGVTAGGSGPGNNTIYIRGLASTTPALTTAGVAGLAPNVSFYLDEQPLAQPGRNLDVYAADISRVEVLSGPQGTLFGASSQAGVVRMITNKPVIGESESSLEVESRYMPEGDMGSKVEYMTNIPLSNTSALRFVAYRDRRGGYIDQVAGTRSVTESARFRGASYVRANGLPVGSSRAGFQANANLSAATFLDANAIVNEDVNDVTYEGFRASIASQINDNWDALVTVATQDIDSDGVFFVDPTLGDLEIQRYTDDSNDDTRSSLSCNLFLLSFTDLSNNFLSITIPFNDGGALRDASFTSPALSPKIARSNFSSGVGSLSPLGVILPINMSPALISAPILIIPFSSRSLVASSETLGISLVNSSFPSLVSLTSIEYSSMWIEVKTSSLTTFSEITIASSKLYPFQGMKATCIFLPKASSPLLVA